MGIASPSLYNAFGDKRSLFKQALGLAMRFSPLNDDEARAIKEKALAGAPLFRFPSWS